MTDRHLLLRVARDYVDLSEGSLLIGNTNEVQGTDQPQK